MTVTAQRETELTTSHLVSVLAICGSLRQGSYNRALLRAAVEAKPQDMVVTEFDFRPLPFYDGDVEAQGDP